MPSPQGHPFVQIVPPDGWIHIEVSQVGMSVGVVREE